MAKTTKLRRNKEDTGFTVLSVVIGAISIVTSFLFPFVPSVLGLAAIFLGAITIIKDHSRVTAIIGIATGVIGVAINLYILSLLSNLNNANITF